MHPHSLMQAFMVIALTAAPRETSYPRVIMRGRYGHELNDNGVGTAAFIRAGITCSLSEKSFCALGHRYDVSRKEHRTMGSLAVRDVVPWGSLVAGHFHFRSGTGLLTGRRDTYTHDRVRGSVPVDTEVALPLRAPSPILPYQGLALSLSLHYGDLYISCHGFASFRERYVKPRYPFAHPRTTSLESITGSVRTTEQTTEPVIRNDYGFVFAVCYHNAITVHLTAVFTDVRRSDGTALVWGAASAQWWQPGIRAGRGSSLFLRYRDGAIDLYGEAAVSAPSWKSPGSWYHTRPAWALLAGMALMHQAFIVKLQFKKAQSRFTAPQGASSVAASSYWLASLTLMPLRKLYLGLAAQESSPPGDTTATGGTYCTRRERLYLRWRPEGDQWLFIAIAGEELLTDTRRRRTASASVNTRLRLLTRLHARFQGRIQSNGHGHPAWLAGGGLHYRPSRLVVLNTTVRHVKAKRSNRIPLKERIPRGSAAPVQYRYRSYNEYAAGLSISGSRGSLALTLMWHQRPGTWRGPLQLSLRGTFRW